MGAVVDVLQEALRQIGDRRRKLEPFVDELKDIEIVDRDLRRTVAKLKKRGGQATVARPNQSFGAIVPNGGGAEPSGSDVKEGTNRERILHVLADHPNGASGAQVGARADVPSGSMYTVLNDLMRDGLITKVGRGFYRLSADANGNQIDASLSDEEREELGERAVG